MDSKILEHDYGIKGVEIISVADIEGDLVIEIETKKDLLGCSDCGSRNVLKRGISLRIIMDVPIGLRPVRIKSRVQRLEFKNKM